MKSIYLIKTTRKPLLLKQGPMLLEDIAGFVARLQAEGWLPSGISVQLVDSKHNEEIAKIECGGLHFHGIPVEYQINGE